MYLLLVSISSLRAACLNWHKALRVVGRIGQLLQLRHHLHIILFDFLVIISEISLRHVSIRTGIVHINCKINSWLT